MERVTFSPGEFAALFGKSQTWGYRQIYAGKVKTITEYGRILIPAAEVERILATAGIYAGLKSKPPKTKAGIQKLAPNLKNAWTDFLKKRRSDAPAKTMEARIKMRVGSASRKEVMDRLTRPAESKRPRPSSGLGR
jgi:hypothetical protein